MKNTLLVGDPHTQLSNLEESKRLFDFIYDISKQENIERLVILGDLFHNHSVLRSEILCFWNDVFIKFSGLNKPVIVLKGNHDENGATNKESTVHSLKVFKDKIKNIIIVDDFLVHEGLLYIAHTSNHEKFINICNSHKNIDTVIAHQNFTEDLFGDKIDPDLMPQKFIISGHVHNTELSKDDVFYAGTPRWLDSKDANKDKGVWILNDQQKEFISTEKVCTVIKKYLLKEGDKVPEINPLNRNYLELEGTSAWILQMKKKLKDIDGLQIKGAPTDTRTVQNKENIKTINDFLKTGFKPIDGVSLGEIQEYIGAI